jgi:hypothetical protein
MRRPDMLKRILSNGGSVLVKAKPALAAFRAMTPTVRPAFLHPLKHRFQPVSASKFGESDPVEATALVLHALEDGKNVKTGDTEECAYDRACQHVTKEVQAQDDARGSD